MLLRAFARTVGGDCKRVQFTPDLLPSDLTGIHFYNQKTGEFEFRPGPLFSHFVLADELNRATPRTQSALLEAMEERQITVDGVTTRLEEPFMVLATQNPIGVFRHLPAAGCPDGPLLHAAVPGVHAAGAGAGGHRPALHPGRPGQPGNPGDPGTDRLSALGL